MIASEWLDRGSNTDDPFDAFSSFWIAFNNLYSESGQGSEISKIRAYIRLNVSVSAAEVILTNRISEINYLVSRPVVDMRGNGRDSGTSITNFFTSDNSIEKLQSLFEILYQIRCNFVHGQKSPNAERDMHLCHSASIIVRDVVDLCVSGS